MHKVIAGAVKKIMGQGEKTGSIKSIKLKVKFSQKVDKKKLDRSKESGAQAKKRLGLK